jgi:hypothetical protein
MNNGINITRLAHVGLRARDMWSCSQGWTSCTIRTVRVM